jgi:hypothetical protein
MGISRHTGLVRASATAGLPAGSVVTLGIDTGSGTAGFQLGAWRRDPDGFERKAAFTRAWQVDAGGAASLLLMLLGVFGDDLTAAGIEMFVASRKGLKGTSPEQIRRQQHELEAILADCGIPCQARTASMVKNWATDERLARAGVLDITNPAAMKHHARDGGRHMTFAATWDCGLPDPLSRRRLPGPGATGQEPARSREAQP